MTFNEARTPTSGPHFSFARSLLRQLQAYGLNPRDWRIDRASWNKRPGAFALCHRSDADFRFKVQYSEMNQGRMYLEKLSLLSL